MTSAHPGAIHVIPAVVLTLAMLTSSAGAQFVSSVEIGMRHWSTVRQATQSPTATVAADASWKTLRVSGNSSASLGERAPTLIDGGLAAVGTVRLTGWLQASGSGQVAHAWLDPTTAATYGSAEGRLRWAPSDEGGVWVSAGRVWSWRDDHPPPGTEAGAGLWTTVRRLALSATVVRRAGTGLAIIEDDSSGIDPKTCRAVPVESPPRPVARCMRRSSTTDLTLGARWHLGIAEMGAGFGTRLAARGAGPGERIWGMADVNIQLLSNISGVARVSRQPRDILRGLPDRSTFSLGLRFHPGRRSSNIDPEPRRRGPGTAAERVVVGDAGHDDVRAVRIEVPDAHRVEVRGDMTAWRIVELERSGGHAWIGHFRMPAGVYHLAIRVNGGTWRAPTGLATTDDGFGGEIAIIVVKDRSPAVHP